MTQLIRALSEQAATVPPSPPAVAFEQRIAPQSQASPAGKKDATAVHHTPTAPSPALQHAVKAAAAQIEAYLKANGRELKFTVDEPSGEIVVTVRDSRSGEVIRQIPSDEALRLARALGDQPNALIDIST